MRWQRASPRPLPQCMAFIRFNLPLRFLFGRRPNRPRIKLKFLGCPYSMYSKYGSMTATTVMSYNGLSSRNTATVDTLIPHTCRGTAKSMGFHRLWLLRISAHPLAPLGTHNASTSWTIGRVKYVLWLTNMNVLPVTSNVYRTDVMLGICSLEWRLSAPRDLCTSP